MYLSIGLLLTNLVCSSALTKVVVPAIFHEWDQGMPHWATDAQLQKRLGYSVFAYQKLDPNQPRYFGANRGTETGVYLKYIVDHYDSFPDVAIFIHAHPHEHQDKWLDMVGAIGPEATYYNINKPTLYVRSSGEWKPFSVTMEQCWRDMMRTVWELDDQDEEFHRRLPPTEPFTVSIICCNQFLLSRSMVRKRPLHVWQALLTKIALQPACHLGEPDYENLHEFHATGRKKCGPEIDVNFQPGGKFFEKEHAIGRAIPGLTGEHLSHVIFGHKPFNMSLPTQEETCQNFLYGAPGSPCVTAPPHYLLD